MSKLNCRQDDGENVGTHTPIKTQRLEACQMMETSPFSASIPSFFEAEYAANHSADLAPQNDDMGSKKLYRIFLCKRSMNFCIS